MRRLIVTLLVVLCLPGLAAAQQSAYQINAGDVLDVSVWGEEDLTRQVLVLPDGTMTVPLAGQMQAEGRTTAELEEEMRQGLARYVPNALVTIGVYNAAGNRFYVTGEMNVRFLAPAVPGDEIFARGEIAEDRRRYLLCRGEILAADGRLLAKAEGKFFAVPPDKQAEMEARWGREASGPEVRP